MSEYIADAGEVPIAMIVDGSWVDWSPAEAARHILQAQGWSTLDEDGRKALALRWIKDSLPPGRSIQTDVHGGHLPEISLENGDVIVRAWLIRSSTSIGGLRVARDQVATLFRFKTDGSMIETDPTLQQSSH